MPAGAWSGEFGRDQAGTRARRRKGWEIFRVVEKREVALARLSRGSHPSWRDRDQRRRRLGVGRGGDGVRAKGPARSKKPGCSIEVSAARGATWAMTRSHRLEIAAFRSSLTRRSGTVRFCRSRFEQSLAISARSGPSGDCQMRLKPVACAPAELSKMKLALIIDGLTARGLDPTANQRRRKTAPCMPIYRGRRGRGNAPRPWSPRTARPPRESCEHSICAFRY